MDASARKLETSTLRESAENKNADAIRRNIGALLQDPYFQKTLDKESLKNYQELVNKKGHIRPNDATNLHKFYDFMQESFKEVLEMKKRITTHVEQAIRDKVITEKDRQFYKQRMKENVVNGNQIVTKEILEKAEKEILESLDNRRKERKEYDKIAQSHLIQNGYLVLNASKKFPLINENQYLQMTVPERRKWLTAIQKQLPEAEKYFEEDGGLEADKLTQEYRKKLESARAEGLIGHKTIDKFMEGFKKADRKEKERWMKESESQMERYRALWEEIRETLDNEDVTYLEGIIDRVGYSELSDKFEELLEEKKEAMVGEYQQKILEAREQGIISKHTAKAFLKDMERQSMKGRQHYLEAFDDQMGRYESLRAGIENMKDKKAQEVLYKMYEDQESGYTEIMARYKRLAGKTASSESMPATSYESLNGITNKSVKQGIIESAEELGMGERKTLVGRLTHFFERKRSEETDTTSYQQNISHARKEQRKAIEEAEKENKEQADSQEVPLARLFNQERPDEEEDDEVFEVKNPKAVVITKSIVNDDFEQKTFINPEQEDTRVVSLTLNAGDAVRVFNSEIPLNETRDQLSVAIWDGSKNIEMKKHEINAAIRYLSKDKQEEEETVAN